MDNRPRATFRTDVRECIGRIYGPNTAGEYLTMDEVTDNGDGTWTAVYRYATQPDFDREMSLLRAGRTHRAGRAIVGRRVS